MIYNSYTNRIKDIVSKRHQRDELEKAWSNFSGPVDTVPDRKQMIREQRNFSKTMQLNAQPLGSILHPAQLEGAKLGVHTDFKHLKGTDDIEYHYIVSIFIDIQGSTNLHKHYDLEEIYSITNT